jgi:hypothetical protein
LGWREYSRSPLKKHIQFPKPAKIRTAVQLVVLRAKIHEFQESSVLPIQANAQ